MTYLLFATISTASIFSIFTPFALIAGGMIILITAVILSSIDLLINIKELNLPRLPKNYFISIAIVLVTGIITCGSVLFSGSFIEFLGFYDDRSKSIALFLALAISILVIILPLTTWLYLNKINYKQEFKFLVLLTIVSFVILVLGCSFTYFLKDDNIGLNNSILFFLLATPIFVAILSSAMWFYLKKIKQNMKIKLNNLIIGKFFLARCLWYLYCVLFGTISHWSFFMIGLPAIIVFVISLAVADLCYFENERVFTKLQNIWKTKLVFLPIIAFSVINLVDKLIFG